MIRLSQGNPSSTSFTLPVVHNVINSNRNHHYGFSDRIPRSSPNKIIPSFGKQTLTPTVALSLPPALRFGAGWGGGMTSVNRRTCIFAYHFSMWLREPLLNSTPPVGWLQPKGEGGGEGRESQEEGKGGVVSSRRRKAPSEAADKRCFQTREGGGGDGHVLSCPVKDEGGCTQPLNMIGALILN